MRPPSRPRAQCHWPAYPRHVRQPPTTRQHEKGGSVWRPQVRPPHARCRRSSRGGREGAPRVASTRAHPPAGRACARVATSVSGARSPWPAGTGAGRAAPHSRRHGGEALRSFSGEFSEVSPVTLHVHVVCSCARGIGGPSAGLDSAGAADADACLGKTRPRGAPRQREHAGGAPFTKRDAHCILKSEVNCDL